MAEKKRRKENGAKIHMNSKRLRGHPMMAGRITRNPLMDLTKEEQEKRLDAAFKKYCGGGDTKRDLRVNDIITIREEPGEIRCLPTSQL